MNTTATITSTEDTDRDALIDLIETEGHTIETSKPDFVCTTRIPYTAAGNVRKFYQLCYELIEGRWEGFVTSHAKPSLK